MPAASGETSRCFEIGIGSAVAGRQTCRHSIERWWLFLRSRKRAGPRELPRHHLSAEELRETPDEEQQVHNSEEHGKADFAARPPLTVLSNGPCRMDDRRIIAL